jgi:hypothetical protein
MSASELICDPADDRLWVLHGVGTLRRTGRMSRAATAEAAGGRSWQIVRHGWVRTGFRATDGTGAAVGELQDTLMRRGERLRWGDRELALRPDGRRRGGYELLDGERRLVTMTPKRPHKRALDIGLVDEALDPGLLLFVAFIVQAYADDASFSSGSAP